jgi:hypothetical protein
MKQILLAGFTALSLFPVTALAQPWVTCDLTITNPVATGTSSSGGDVIGEVRHYELVETGNKVWSDTQDDQWRSSSSNGKFSFTNDFVRIIANGHGTFENQKTWKAVLMLGKTVNAQGTCNWIDQE